MAVAEVMDGEYKASARLNGMKSKQMSQLPTERNTENERVESPCNSICVVGMDEVCIGCGRTLEEIGRWLDVDDAERLEISARARIRMAERES